MADIDLTNTVVNCKTQNEVELLLAHLATKHKLNDKKVTSLKDAWSCYKDEVCFRVTGTIMYSDYNYYSVNGCRILSYSDYLSVLTNNIDVESKVEFKCGDIVTFKSSPYEIVGMITSKRGELIIIRTNPEKNTTYELGKLIIYIKANWEKVDNVSVSLKLSE